MTITVDTQFIGFLGKPLRHSVSPRMQNETYEALGLDYCYLPIEVESDGLEAVVNGIRRMPFRGFAVTTPHKTAILRYLDELDEEAQRIGAVNTVVKNGARLKGYNTDGHGCLRSLREEGGVKIAGETFFVFGAGGAARAVCFALAQSGAGRVYICSRSSACEELSLRVNRSCPGVCASVRAADTAAVQNAVQSAGAVLNLSGLGMPPDLNATPCDKAWLLPPKLCYDAAYQPVKTRFLLEAEAQGCRILNGLGMVIYQGALQAELWTSAPDPAKLMRASALRAIEEREKAL